MINDIKKPKSSSLNDDEKQFIADFALKDKTPDKKVANSKPKKENKSLEWIKKHGLLTAGVTVFVLFFLSLFINRISISFQSSKNTGLIDETVQQPVSLQKPAGLSGIKMVLFEVDELLANKKYASAETKLLNTLKTTKNKSEQAEIQLKLGIVYISGELFNDAIVVCKKAEQLGLKDNRVNLCVAQAAERKGDKKLAIYYYQKAFEAVKDVETGVDDEAESYKQKIAELNK